MITTTAADTLAGLFAGTPVMGDPTVASGVAFGQVLSASADMPAAPMTPPIFRTMPGIATLPIGTLMGTESLPFQASTLPSALAWSGVSLPVTTGGTMQSASQPMAILAPTVASMPITSAQSPAVLVTDASRTATPPAPEPTGRGLPVIDRQSSMTTVPFTMVNMSIKSVPSPTVVTDGSLTDVPPVVEETEQRITVIDRPPSMKAVPFTMADMPIKSAPLPATVVTDGSVIATPPSPEPTGRPAPLIHGPSMPIAIDTPKAPISVGTAPAVEAPLPETATFDLPAPTPAKAETATAMPTTDGSEAPLPPASVGKVERPMVVPEQLAESPVAPTVDTLTASPADPAPSAPNETAPAAGGKGKARHAEAKEKAPDMPGVISVDPLTMLSPAPLPAAMPSGPSGKPAITEGGEGFVSSDDDRSDSVDYKPVKGSSSGAVPLPAEMVVAPMKTITVAPEKPTPVAAPSVQPALVPPSQTNAVSPTAVDIGKTAAPDMVTPKPHLGNAQREEGRITETSPPNAQPASFANLVTHTEKTAAPAPAPAASTPSPEPRVAAQPGRMGQEMGVAIARHAATGGGEAMTVRLDPVEFGRIEVTLSFDDSGTIRAVVAAESPAALDLLRRDSADLGRSLAEAGIRSDAQSFRFDTRQGGADGSGQGGQRWQQQAAAGTRAAAQAADDIPKPVYRPLRSQGRVDLMA